MLNVKGRWIVLGFTFRHTRFCSFFSLLFFLFSLSVSPSFFISHIRTKASLLCNIRVWKCVYSFRSTLEATSFWPLFNYTFPLCKCRATKEWLNIRSLLDFTSLGLFFLLLLLLAFFFATLNHWNYFRFFSGL